MPEHQTIEWKAAWHDEFLEWICGYANAYGEALYIGKNDSGDVIGLSDKDRKTIGSDSKQDYRHNGHCGRCQLAL